MGLTQNELAARIRIARNTVARMESGLQAITPSMELLIGFVAREAGVEVIDTRSGGRVASPKAPGRAGAGHTAGKSRRWSRQDPISSRRR
jgi:transcriptional regulator with XRE-family HTH domain